MMGLKKQQSGKFQTSRVFQPPEIPVFPSELCFRVIKINVLKRPNVGFPPWETHRPSWNHGLNMLLFFAFCHGNLSKGTSRTQGNSRPYSG